MEESRNRETAQAERPEAAPENEYPATVESLSEKWRSAQQEVQAVKGNMLQRHFLAIGIGVALLIIAAIIVIGGFSFLVWNAH